MSVTAFDGQFSFKQDSLARLGSRASNNEKMSAEQHAQFQNSPFMRGVRKTEELCWQFTSARDQTRAATDPAFKPQDSDFDTPKTHDYSKAINYYKVLGVDEFAPLEEIKKSYKKLSLVYHPDKTHGLDDHQKEEYAAIFIELKNAYLTLSDQATRRQYDRDCDKDKASFEINGFKPKKRAHFDATEILQKLAENVKPDGDHINVPIMAKLEKFFFGGHKAIKRQQKLKAGKEQPRLYRVDIHKGAPEPYECIFRKQGDHHEERMPDTLHFHITSKPHELLERDGDDLVFKRSLALGSSAHLQPFISAETPTVRGRHLLFWGRNPFFRATGTGGAELRVKVRGESLNKDGQLRLVCRLGSGAAAPATSRSAAGAASGASAKPASNSAPAQDTSQIDLKIVHMQTDASIFIRVRKDATISEVRAKIPSILALPKGSTVRLLKKLEQGNGFTPYPDAMKVEGFSELKCAGSAWYGIKFSPQKAKEFLEAILGAAETETFKAEMAAARASRGASNFDGPLFQYFEHLLPEYGLEPKPTVLAERVTTALADVNKLPAGKHLQEKIAALMQPPAPPPTPASGSSAGLGTSRPQGTGLKSFLQRHKLGPPDGFDAGSDSEGEAAGRNGGGMHGQGGVCKAPAMLRRVASRLRQEPACEVELTPMGDPIMLGTKPTCSIAFYWNAHQSRSSTQPGLLAPEPMYAISLSSPHCSKRVAQGEWQALKSRLVPLLQKTAFVMLRPACAILPRPLADYAAFPGEYKTAGDVDSERVAEDEIFDFYSKASAVARETAKTERMAFLRRQAVRERRAHLAEGVAVPWKRLGAEAFYRGEYFTALEHYARALEALSPESPDDTAAAMEAAAVLMSNRSACLVKAQHFEEALKEARRARELRPNWGKASFRVGVAAWSVGNRDEAVEAYLRAVECDPRGAHVSALAEAVALRGPLNAAEAHGKKELGNGAFRVNELGLAVAHYTYGLALIPPMDLVEAAAGKSDEHSMLRSVLLSNRSAAFARLKAWDLAVTDGRGAVAAKEDFAKAHCRLGTALLGSGLPEHAYTSFAKALRLDPQEAAPLRGRQACVAVLPLWRSKLARLRTKERFGRDLTRPAGSTKVYCVSDMHYDHKVNEEWAHRIDDFQFQEDVLVLAGNLCDSKGALVRALTTLKSKFRRIFYVPGNHELAVTASEQAKYPDSLAKLLGIMEVCDELDVDIFPAAVASNVFVVPMLSWYHAEFDHYDPFPDPTQEVDKFCRWPLDPETQVWKYMLKLNEAHLRHPYHGTVISCSHFVPRATLPINREGKAAKSMGCEDIDEQVRSIKVKNRVHVYGHSTRAHALYENQILYANHYHGEEGGQDDRAPIFLIYDGKAITKRPVEIYEGPQRI